MNHGPIVGLGVGSGARAVGSLSAADSSTIGVSGGGDEADGSLAGFDAAAHVTLVCPLSCKY